jgi:hypothetical protein
VLGLVRREAEEDLGDDVVDQRAWRRRRHTGFGWGLRKSRIFFFLFEGSRSEFPHTTRLCVHSMCRPKRTILVAARQSFWPSSGYIKFLHFQTKQDKKKRFLPFSLIKNMVFKFSFIKNFYIFTKNTGF